MWKHPYLDADRSLWKLKNIFTLVRKKSAQYAVINIYLSVTGTGGFKFAVSQNVKTLILTKTLNVGDIIGFKIVFFMDLFNQGWRIVGGGVFVLKIKIKLIL